MKIKNTKWIALLAFTGLAISTQSAHAAAQLGDLIFGVRDVSTTAPNNNVYLFDLGTPPPSGSTVASALAADLSALYGADWFTNTSLKWSVSGYDPNTGDLLGSKLQTTFGTQSAPYSPSAFSGAQINTIENKMNNVYTQFNNGSDAGVAGFTAGGYSAAGGDAALKADVNGYNSFMPGYSTFGANFEANGFSNQALDIYDISGNQAGDVVYGGTFHVDSSGNVTFSSTPGAATPEAGGGLALMMIGLGCLVPLRRFMTKRA
jgi:hypothetical protein